MLRVGSVKSVYHGASSVLTLKELVRCYTNLVEDSTRVMLRIKALFRARAILTPGTSVYRASERAKWLARIESREVRPSHRGRHGLFGLLEFAVYGFIVSKFVPPEPRSPNLELE